MSSRIIFFCACACLFQSITAQCYSRPTSPTNSRVSNTPCFVKTLVGTDGSPFTITCACPISPNGVSVKSDLGIEGQLDVKGSLPFLSAVKLEGSLPSSGQASTSYSCGDGNVIIVQETGNPCGPNARVESGVSLANLANVRRN